MKKLLLAFLLFTGSLSAQEVFNDTCLTLRQVNFLIEECFIVKYQQQDLILAEKRSDALSMGITELGKSLGLKNQEIDLHILQNKECQADKADLTKLLNKAELRIKLQKVGICIVGGVAIAELAYIGILSVAK